MFYVLSILKSKAGNTIGARIRRQDGSIIKVPIDELKNSYGKVKFENAILDSRGFLRAKKGKLKVEILNIENVGVMGSSVGILNLYHGSPNNTLVPKYGGGKNHNDFGAGLYTTTDIELAKEWAGSFSVTSGYVYNIILNTSGLNIFRFSDNDTESVLQWMAELLYHRSGQMQEVYLNRVKRFVAKYRSNIIGNADIIYGWRADASFYLIAKSFARGDLDVPGLHEALKLGNLGYQYVIKSKKSV